MDLLKDNFLNHCNDELKIIKRCMITLAMIYSCFFLIAITLAGISLMFYAFLKRQGYLITFMQVLWNIIRYFMFYFFIFGAFYGIFSLVLKDYVAVAKKLFESDSYFAEKDKPATSFFQKCLKNSNYNLAYDTDIIPEIYKNFFI